jgi:hypothetical protein
MMLSIGGRCARRSVPLLLESQVYIAGAVDVLHLLSVELVLLDVVCVIVERVSNAIDLASDLLFNFGLGVDLPYLSEFAPELEVDATSDKSITASLMHGSDPVNVKFFGYRLESSGEIEFSLDLLAIVVIDEVCV